jgi:hypothetical protein
MAYFLLPPLLGLLSFLVINVGGFLVMASENAKRTVKGTR